MRLGLHGSVRHGLTAGLEYCASLGCETLQLFTRAPRLWRKAQLTDSDAAHFRNRRTTLGLHPLIMHTPFLPNLCTRDVFVRERTERALAEDLMICQKAEADYLVIHPGAFSPGASVEEGIERMMKSLNEAIARFPRTQILIENMAGGARRVGSRWEELRLMFQAVSDASRLGVCLDTAHTYGAGHAFSSPEDVKETLSAFDRAVGLGRIRVIHVNDSEAEAGSHLDLHEHLGKGKIGLETLKALFSDARLEDPALILETPRDTSEDDLRNLKVLRSLVK